MESQAEKNIFPQHCFLSGYFIILTEVKLKHHLMIFPVYDALKYFCCRNIHFITEEISQLVRKSSTPI